MLTVVFNGLASNQRQQFGPVPQFRLPGGLLLAEPDGREVASYREGLWQHSGNYYLRLEVPGPAQIAFEQPGGPCLDPLGPFDCIHIVDGSLRHGEKGQVLLAKLDERSQAWFVYGGQRHCPTAVLRPVLPGL